MADQLTGNIKVALITDGITPYVIGGMQKHSYYLAKYLAKNGIHVDLFHYNNSSMNIDAMEVFSEEERAYIRSVVVDFPVSARFPGHYIYNSYRYSKRIFEAIQPHLHTYDFIYTKGFSGWKLISDKHQQNIACCDIGVKFHGYEMYQAAPDFKIKLQHLMLRPFVKKLSRQADKVFSYGGHITDIIKSLGVDASHIVELPSGIENSFIAPGPTEDHDPVKFIFIGRNERRKGIDELNAAINSLVHKQVNVQFSFIGPIPEDRKIKQPGITYYGEVRNAAEINAILRQHDVLICPSWSEGFPNVILEAMAGGLAIIASNVGAINTMVDETNGLLIPPGNPAALEKAIQSIKIKGNLEALKKESLHKITTSFNWDRIVKKLIPLIAGPHV